MLNKPKYNILKNTKYALEGLYDILKNESSFKAQLIAFTVLSVLTLFLPLGYTQKSIMIISLFLPLLGEVINSAIERVVDLVTLEYNELAKRAKDIGATIVFLSYFIVAIIWFSVLLY